MWLQHTFLKALLIVALVINAGIAKEEPTSWFFGAGVGLSKVDKKYSDSAKMVWDKISLLRFGKQLLLRDSRRI